MVVIGTCNVCGGAVQVPKFWTEPGLPIPTCVRCGAVAKGQYGPLIPMEGLRWIDWPKKQDPAVLSRPSPNSIP